MKDNSSIGDNHVYYDQIGDLDQSLYKEYYSYDSTSYGSEKMDNENSMFVTDVTGGTYYNKIDF